MLLMPRAWQAMAVWGRVFMKNGRVIVGIGDTRTSQPYGRLRDVLGLSARASYSRALLMSQFWQNLQPRLQTAGSERQHGRSGQEVVERLLFDWVDAEAA